MHERKITDLESFRREIGLPRGDAGNIPGRQEPFLVFDIGELHRTGTKGEMPYNRRTYYKISLLRGRNRAEYADKIIEIERNGLLFATPHVPYHYLPLEDDPSGYFCVFTREFLAGGPGGTPLDELPIFRPGQVPLFEITDAQAAEIEPIFHRMLAESGSDYAYRTDLLRTYLLELIHAGQKLQPKELIRYPVTAADRIAGLFRELLERQFPGISPAAPLRLRRAGDYAEQLALHVNYLNQVLKAQTGKTTTEIIGERIVKESKVLLRHSDWSVSEIAYALGFDELSHFSNFFKRHTQLAPMTYRG